mgnify:CR=1 FL=1
MTRETLLLVLLAILAGGLGAIHVPINGALGVRLQSTAVATLCFYGVAFGLAVLLNLAFFDRAALAGLREVPPFYLIVPGLISLVVVGANTFLIPRLGAFTVFVVAIAAQVVVRSLISHFGWLDSPVAPINVARVLGGLLVVAGAVLVVRG